MTPVNLVLFFVALVCLSQSASLIKWVGAPVFIIGMWRMWMASAGLLPLVLRQRELKSISKYHPDSVKALVLSGFLLFLHFCTYFYSAQNTKVAHCMIIFATNPLFTALGAAIFLKEKITSRLVLAYVLAACGVWLLVAHSLKFEPASALGDLSALLSAIFYAAYFLTSFRARKEFSNTTLTFVVFFITAICFTVASFSEPNWTDYSPRAWFGIFLLAILPTILGHGLLSYLVKFININILSCGKLVEPAIASITAYFLFHEIPTGSTLIAYLASALSLLVLFFPLAPKRNSSPT
ncbi:MAG: DMT family transporter [Pseudobdellovibrionaceae bacterium]